MEFVIFSAITLLASDFSQNFLLKDESILKYSLRKAS